MPRRPARPPLPDGEVALLRAGELTAAQRSAWSTLQLADPDLASPFFRPELTLAAAAADPRVEVAVISRAGRPVAFFPFRRGRGETGTPVAGGLSDYHGVIAERGLELDALALVRACGLRAWHFDHVPAAQHPFAAHATGGAPSPYLDLRDGFDAYSQARRAAGSQGVRQALRRGRALAREVGALRFEAADADSAALERVLALKSAQYRASGKLDVLASPAVTGLLAALHGERGSDFAGMLSTLHAGDRLVAAHLGLRSRTIWHYWLPAYDPAFGHYAPGLVLLLEMARAAERLGLERIDLGKGSEPYKARFATGEVPLLEGSVTDSRLHGAAHALKLGADGLARRSRAGTRALEAARAAKRRLGRG